MSEIDYEARVAKGIALLDEKVPGWPDKINLNRLNIGNASFCVTAQLSGENDWILGMEQLGLEQGEFNTGSYTMHGFNVEAYGASTIDDDDYDGYDALATLNNIWEREITARQTAPKEG